MFKNTYTRITLLHHCVGICQRDNEIHSYNCKIFIGFRLKSEQKSTFLLLFLGIYVTIIILDNIYHER